MRDYTQLGTEPFDLQSEFDETALEEFDTRCLSVEQVRIKRKDDSRFVAVIRETGQPGIPSVASPSLFPATNNLRLQLRTERE